MNYTWIKILFLILFGLNTSSATSQEQTSFTHISPNTLIEYRVIKNTIQDQLGYIWISQNKGIIKYDGYEFWFYSIESIFNKNNIDDTIEKIEVDGNGNILILSKKGLLAKREINGSFTQLNNFHHGANKIPLINKIFIKKSQVWLTDYSGTIYLKNKNTSLLDSITTISDEKFNKIDIIDIEITKNNDLLISTNIGLLYKLSKNILQEIQGPFNDYPGIMYLTLGKNDDLWIGTENMGLFQYNISKDLFIKHSYYRNQKDILANDMILSLYCDNDGNIWAGSDGKGLYRINPIDGKIKLFSHNSFDKSSLSSNVVIDINEDSNNNLWVITNYGDINILPGNKSNIYHHKGSIKNISARVLSILKDSKNNIWIGTDGKGLSKTNLISGDENQYLTIKNSIEGFYIQSISEDKNGNIWVGTYKNGLWFYDSKKEKISKVIITNFNGIQANDVLTIYNDSKGRIWVGTDVALLVFNTKKEKIATFPFTKKGLYGELVRTIIEDSNNTIWIGMDGGGLFKFNELETLKNSSFQNLEYTHNLVTYHSITSIAADKKGGMWIVNSEGELYYFNTIDYTFKEYKDYEPFKKIAFHAVLMENDNQLWLSSNHGLWNFNTEDAIIKKYFKTDGFNNDYYIQRSAFKDKSGFLYFGGINGINGFRPNLVSKTPVVSKLHINTVEILNKSASILIPEQTEKGIDQLKILDLKYNQSSFSFQFSALGNILNNNYTYAYRLKGFNDDWKITENKRMATYTNIPAGDYTFEVKAATEKGNWDIPLKALNIKVNPPFWKHSLMYILYFIMFCAIIYSLYKWYKLRKKMLFQKVKSSEEKKAYDEKMNFFSKMSHEIQTPLALILGPIEDLLKNSQQEGNSKSIQRLKVVSNNAKRLSRIASELTTIRNKEIGQLKLKIAHEDIVTELKKISESFLEEAQFKKIEFIQKNFKNSYLLWFDKKLIEHIIYNLLSNAFKFTPKEGVIKLETKLNLEKDTFIIVVEDSGYGISKSEQKNIFKLFYRINKEKYSEGTGIGLALVKELIDLHKGEISVNSKHKKGAQFIVSLPLGKTKYTNDEIIDYGIKSAKPTQASSKTPIELTHVKTSKNKNQTLLIIEDNFEMLSFLENFFSDSYKVHLAHNGAEGMVLAEKEQPNIIISDINMPIMNGLELCRNLQNNKNTSHIPVILLTANNTTKLKGLEYGAIEFIHKPFDINELQLKMNNILTLQEKIYSNFALRYISTPEQNKSKSKDILFLEKLISTLNSELDNPDFKLESLSISMNLSYSSIYKKCQHLTGKTIVDLFRLMRLKKSAILICKNNYNISQACFAVGFNDTRYFSKCFKTHFKLTPSTFKKEAKDSNLDSFLEKYELIKFETI